MKILVFVCVFIGSIVVVGMIGGLAGMRSESLAPIVAITTLVACVIVNAVFLRPRESGKNNENGKQHDA